MTDYLKRTWAAVNLDRIAHNAAAIRKTLPAGCMLMGVVKADAYGHGEKYVAHELARAGADWFGVSSIDEAVSLRTQGISLPILIFGITPAERAGTLSEYSLAQTIHSTRYGQELHEAASRAGVRLDVHIKTDTGMSRLGFDAKGDSLERSAAEILEVASYTHFNAQGIYTHFACADELEPDSVAYTNGQFERFKAVVARLEGLGRSFPIKHCCNSAGMMLYPEMHMDMVRPGIALYGFDPSPDCAGKLNLKPVMELYSVVSMVKEIEAGTPVSYGRRFTARDRTKVATVPIGYADGFGRALSNQARMLVRGQFADVIGTVCMDQLMLDVTHIEDVAAGDLVTVVGRDGENELTFDELADLSRTIHYERVCAVGKRVPRVYRRGGEDIGVMDYNSGAKVPEL